MKGKQDVTRSQFIQAVKAFKSAHPGKKLKDLLSEKTSETTKAFFANPIIRAYLQRPSVSFVDRHPDLHDSDTKREHDNSDHYELKVYKYLPDILFFRDSSINDASFYQQGTATFDEIYDSLSKSLCAESADIRIECQYDCGQIIRDVHTQRFVQLESKPFPRFHIYSNRKDDHQTTIISILEPKTGEVLLSLFLNSWQSDSYYNYIKYRYFLDNTLYDRTQQPKVILDNAKDYLQKTFSFNFDAIKKEQKPEILTNYEEKAALCLFRDNSFKLEEKYEELRNSDKINMIYDYYYNGLFVLKVLPRNRFIDVSHKLQVGKDDGNCGLYSLNFMCAVTKILSDPRNADRIFELAKAINADKNAEAELVKIFREDLKAYLPCYYEANSGQARTADELREFHLNQRWELGGRSLPLRYPQ